jgi:citrate lyase subunit beta/citryl-CoA lyase
MSFDSMRSLLLLPADDEAKLDEALDSRADGVCLDYTDAGAREKICAWIAAAKSRTPRPLIFVRVNALDTALIDADLDAIMPEGPDGVVLPKCPGGVALQHLGAKLAVKEAECGFPDGFTRILAMAAGAAASIFNMGSYAGASRRLEGLLWSAENLAAPLGSKTSRDPDGPYAAPYVLARSLTLCAARAAGVLAIDSACAEARDSSALRLECEAARRDGFDGKLALNREQVDIINAVFAASC